MISRTTFKIIAIVFFFFLASQVILAQPDEVLKVEVDKTSLSTDETLTLTVSVNSNEANLPRPTLPELVEFNILSSGSSSQISLINGVLNTQFTYYYALQPIETGEITIDPVRITIDGQTYTSDPIVISVSQGSQPPAGRQPGVLSTPENFTGQDLFVEAEIDNPDPYVGEQVVYTFRFYTSRRVGGQPRYEAPSFTGFWHEQLPDQNQYTLQSGGQVYRITELQTILFPTRAGSLGIEAGTLALPGGLTTLDQDMKTQAIPVEVQALPPGAPDDFQDAVGLFSIDAEISNIKGLVNEPLTLLVTLSGQGNLQTLSDPIWPEIAGWRFFEDQTSLDTVFENGNMTGRKIYKRLLVPGEAGEFTIPPITYSFFDPNDEVYRTVSTQAIPVSIAEGVDEPPILGGVGLSRDGVERRATDIRHIKAVPVSLGTSQAAITANPLYWLAWLIPLVLIAGNIAWLRYQAYLIEKSGTILALRAAQKAQKRIEAARREGQDTYLVVGQVLNTYISEKLNQPVQGLTQSELSEVLAYRGIDTDLIKRVHLSLVESDMGRFSPDAPSAKQTTRLLDDLENLIVDLEEVFQA